MLGPIHVQPGEPSQLLVTALQGAGGQLQPPSEPRIVVRDALAQEQLHPVSVQRADAYGNVCTGPGAAMTLQLLLQSGQPMAAAGAGAGGDVAMGEAQQLQEVVVVQEVEAAPGVAAEFDGAALPQLLELLEDEQGPGGHYQLLLRDASGALQALPDFLVRLVLGLPGQQLDGSRLAACCPAQPLRRPGQPLRL